MACCCLCNFLKRSFLYQILITIAALKFQNAFRYNREFVGRISTFLSSIGLPENLVNYLPENEEYTHKGFLIFIIVSASFSILGINFFKIISGICCILLSFLFHNPILKYKELSGKKIVLNLETLEQYLPDLEFILYIGIAFAMFGNAFGQKVCKANKGEEKEIKKENLIDLDEKSDKKNNKEVKENKIKQKSKPKSSKKKKD